MNLDSVKNRETRNWIESKKTIEINGRNYKYNSIRLFDQESSGLNDRLPYSLKLLLENTLSNLADTSTLPSRENFLFTLVNIKTSGRQITSGLYTVIPSRIRHVSSAISSGVSAVKPICENDAIHTSLGSLPVREEFMSPALEENAGVPIAIIPAAATPFPRNRRLEN